VLVSFGSVASPDQKRKLRESFGAEAVDMEAAAVGRAAQAHQLQFCAIKAVSDEADFEFPSIASFVDAQGQFSEWKFGFFVGLRPWLWRQVIKLGRNSHRAARALSASLVNRCDPGKLEHNRQQEN
jgi:adenosylhomocysteine nucleosidase